MDLIPFLTQSAQGRLKPLTEAKEEFERGYLKEIVQLTGGNISRAAQIAGRYRADFYKLLRKYGLHPGDGKPPLAVHRETAGERDHRSGEGSGTKAK